MIFSLPLLTIALICLAVLLLVKYFIDNRNYYKNAFTIPSFLPMIPSFLVGWIIMPLGKFDFYQVLCSRYLSVAEDLTSMWMPSFIVIPRKAEQLKIIYESTDLLNKSIHYDTLKIAVGESALISSGAETFRAPKKVLMTCFNGSSQQIVIDTFYRSSEFLINTLNKAKMQHEGGWFKLHDISREIAIRSVLWSSFDMDVTQTILNSLHDFEHFVTVLILSGTLRHNDWPFKLSPFSRIINKAKNVAKTVAHEAMDTTGAAICFILTMLAMHPDILEKVYEEDQKIQEELNGRKMAERDFNRYEYLSRVVKETFRLFPPIPIIAKKTAVDIQLGKYTIPADSSIAIVMPYIHRNPEYYPDPLKFDPDRFLPENVAKRSKYAHIPFSMGQRQCTGMLYGFRNVLFFVSSVIRKFKIFTKYRSIEELDANITGSIVIYDTEEFPIRLELRSPHTY